MERALIEQYKDTILNLLPRLSTDNLHKAAAIAAIPEDIRGFGHVKQRNLEAARKKEARLLAEFEAGLSGNGNSQSAA
jgi:indolepyruvate ferredoxin oxidoreductase